MEHIRERNVRGVGVQLCEGVCVECVGGEEGKVFFGWVFYGIALFVRRGTFFWELEKSLYRNLVRFRF